MNNQDQACIVWSQTYAAVLSSVGHTGDRFTTSRDIATVEANEAVRRWEASQFQPMPPVPVLPHDPGYMQNRPSGGFGGQ